jgi:hypothetical protein
MPHSEQRVHGCLRTVGLGRPRAHARLGAPWSHRRPGGDQDLSPDSSARGGTRSKSGTSPATRRHPTSTNITRRPRMPPPVSTIKTLAGVRPAALHQQTQCRSTKQCPRRAGKSPGWPATSAGGTGPGVDRVWHPVDPPEGYQTATRGRVTPRPSPVASRASPGSPRGRAPPGCSYVVSSCLISAVAAVPFLVLARWSQSGTSASTPLRAP